MEIKITKAADKNQVAISGRVDTVTSTELEEALTPLFEEEAPILELDCTDLEYVSSSGLRMILTAHKQMVRRNKKLVLKHINSEVGSVLHLTGFSNILNISED